MGIYYSIGNNRPKIGKPQCKAVPPAVNHKGIFWFTDMKHGRWSTLWSWCWPEYCLLCRARTGCRDGLCPGCHAELPWLDAACRRCAVALPHDHQNPIADAVCGACQKKTPPTQRTFAALHYAAPIDRIVLDLKYHRRLHLAPLLGSLLGERVAAHLLGPAERPDVIVPVPLHVSRLRERGYNQSLEIARVAARRLGIPLMPSLAQRRRATAAQTTLPLDRRARNVRGAFTAGTDARGLHVAIVDDVMTSGHTVNALAKALRRAGAREISAWVVARA